MRSRAVGWRYRTVSASASRVGAGSSRSATAERLAVATPSVNAKAVVINRLEIILVMVVPPIRHSNRGQIGRDARRTQ